MKKTVKIMSVILVIIMALTSISTIAFADVKSDVKALGENATNSQVINFGKQIVPIVRAVGIIAAVVILMVVGIKYMMGSAEEKAEYKKTMPAYVIGAILVFAASQIIGFIIDISSEIK